MRLFVGVEVSPDVIAAAVELIEAMRQRVNRLSSRSRISWITADRLHITVRFIGHVDDDKARVIRDRMRPPFPILPFDVSVAGVGTFPSGGAPRVVWAGVAQGADALQRLESLVTERLTRVGLAAEDRPYSPHLTLARVREAGGLKSRPLLEGLSARVLGVTPVDAITLFESRLSPKGPTYVALERSPLAGDV